MPVRKGRRGSRIYLMTVSVSFQSFRVVSIAIIITLYYWFKKRYRKTMKLISKEVKIKECGFLSIKKTNLEYLSSIVFHTVINLKLGKNRQKSRNIASFLYRG